MGEGRKAYWPNVGRLVFFPSQAGRAGNFSIELSMFPKEKFYVFEIAPKQDASYQAPPPDDGNQAPATDIRPEDIPY